MYNALDVRVNRKAVYAAQLKLFRSMTRTQQRALKLATAYCILPIVCKGCAQPKEEGKGKPSIYYRPCPEDE